MRMSDLRRDTAHRPQVAAAAGYTGMVAPLRAFEAIDPPAGSR